MRITVEQVKAAMIQTGILDLERLSCAKCALAVVIAADNYTPETEQGTWSHAAVRWIKKNLGWLYGNGFIAGFDGLDIAMIKGTIDERFTHGYEDGRAVANALCPLQAAKNPV